MQKIQLWSVNRAEDKLFSATAVKSVDNTETEQVLEDLLVASPDLLMEGLTLIGRQVAAAGGSLDLLGIDADGRLVVFELKRGTLTRDAHGRDARRPLETPRMVAHSVPARPPGAAQQGQFNKHAARHAPPVQWLGGQPGFVARTATLDRWRGAHLE